MSEELIRDFKVRPGYDKRSSDPSKNYGIGCAIMTWYVKGPKGAVQFSLMTGWYPHIIKKTTFDDWSDWAEMSVTMKPNDAPTPADLGYHSPVPMYEGQTLMDEECPILKGPCYYDGSGLNAYKPFSILVHEGGDRLWEFLEHYYRETFDKDGLGNEAKMTHSEAEKEAQRRWGNADAVMVPLIGCIVTKGGETMGVGRTWEAAFADADKDAAPVTRS